MVIDVIWCVFTRYVMTEQSSWTDELARFLMIWVGVLGGAFASGQNKHIAIDLISNYIKPLNRERLRIFGNIIIIIFISAIFLVGGLRYVYISFYLGQRSPALNIPMGVVYNIFPIAGFIIIYYRICKIKNKDI
jgi:TRAP-type C4-dicarboxylate transport system permease small subunit